MIKQKLIATLASSMFVAAASQAPAFAQSAAGGSKPAGAGAAGATGAAVGGVTTGAVAFGVAAVVFVAAAASGDGGTVASVNTPANTASSATAISTQKAAASAAEANVLTQGALADIDEALRLAGVDATTGDLATKRTTAIQALAAADDAKQAAIDVASDVEAASKVAIIGVVNNGRQICAAANSCTAKEVADLNFKAAQAAVKAADAAMASQKAMADYFNAVRDNVFDLEISDVGLAKIVAARDKVTEAGVKAQEAQALSNAARSDYEKALAALGQPGETVAPPSGTAGTAGTAGTV
jgi:hypothetical protein